MKLELSRQIFEKYSYIKFHENAFIVIRVVSCGQRQTDGWTGGWTDRNEEAKSSFFSQFCERV